MASDLSYTMTLHPFSEYVSDMIAAHGCFECDHLREMQRVVASLSNPVFVDVGGNIGQYSLAAAAAGADVFVFEPLGSNLAIIRDSVVANSGFADRVTVFAAALTNETGRTFHFDQPFEDPNFGATRLRGSEKVIHVGNRTLSKDDSGEHGEEGVSFARGISLDSIAGSFPHSRPVVVKIDIEGGECDFLDGARRFFEVNDVVYVSLELHNSASGNYIPSNCDDPTDMFSFFEGMGFQPYAERGREPLEGDWDSSWSKKQMAHVIWKKPELVSKMAKKKTSLPVLKHNSMRGRLGNQLFEHAALLSLAKEHGMRPCAVGENVNLVDDFFQGASFFERDCEKNDPPILWQERGYGIHTEFDRDARAGESIELDGYFQSYRYFSNAADDVKKAFALKPEYQFHAEELTSGGDAVSVGIHVRHFEDVYLHPPPVEYYESTMEYMRQKYETVKFYVASDVVQWCREQDVFSSEDTLLLNGTDIQDFAVLVNCDHMVLSVGTFGWWAAWLGAYQIGGEVLYFNDAIDTTHPENKDNLRLGDDHFPPEWTQVS